MQRPYLVADAFTPQRFAGNPAGVVFDAEGLSDEQMQAIAAEFNLSETTFVLPPQSPEADVRFRWCTPTVEVSMCGHATIAGVHALLETGRWPADALAGPRIETASGVLGTKIEPIPGSDGQRVIWLDLPTPDYEELAPPRSELGAAFGLPDEAFLLEPAAARTRDADLIVLVQSVAQLNEAKLDRGRVIKLSRRLQLRGVCLATTQTLSPAITVQSRFFAPAAGIDEDPVTGSLHGPLATYLVRQGLVPMTNDLAGLHCIQGAAGSRAGLIRAVVQRQADDQWAVAIGGEAITVMRGQLEV